jgi:hypothetical protein
VEVLSQPDQHRLDSIAVSIMQFPCSAQSWECVSILDFSCTTMLGVVALFMWISEDGNCDLEIHPAQTGRRWSFAWLQLKSLSLGDHSVAWTIVLTSTCEHPLLACVELIWLTACMMLLLGIIGYMDSPVRMRDSQTQTVYVRSNCAVTCMYTSAKLALMDAVFCLCFIWQ